MFRLLRNAWQNLKRSWQQFYEHNPGWQNPETRLVYQLRAMYGRGEIDQQRYKQLRLRLRRGQIWQSDINLIRQQAEQRMEAQGKMPLRYRNKETSRALDRLYVDHVMAEEKLSELEDNLKGLSDKIKWVQEQAETARKEAQASLPDEAVARASLEIWQDLVELSNNLNLRAQNIVQDKQDLKACSVQLSAAITQLKLLETQEELAKLTFHIQQDLLSQDQKR
jgi:hypothetical protein